MMLAKRRGALLLMVLLALVFMAIVAMQVMPGEEIISRRVADKNLSIELSQIREALDLSSLASPAVPLWEPDFDPEHPVCASIDC